MTAPATEEQLLEFLYACPVGLIACDGAGAIGMMNPHAVQHLLPLAAGREIDNLLVALEQHAPEVRNMVASYTARTGKVCDNHRVFVDLGNGRAGAQRKVLALTVVKLGDDRLMATLTDVSAQVAQEQRLQQADAWFASLLDGINDYAVLAIAPDGVVEATHASYTRQTGQNHLELVGRRLAPVLDDNLADGELSLDEQCVVAQRDGWHLQEGWQTRVNGERYWCQRLVVARMRDGGAASERPSTEDRADGFSVVLRDVQRREAISDLCRLLTRDHLTGAANRMHFSQTLEYELSNWRRTGQPLSLVLLDLDHFKTVNDTHGHPAGDRLLCEVTAACERQLPARALFCRLGGEEFGALLPCCDRDKAGEIAEAMRAAIEALEVEVRGGVLKATGSFGYATLDEADESIDGLIALADQRLYAAKKEGRNRVHDPRPIVA